MSFYQRLGTCTENALSLCDLDLTWTLLTVKQTRMVTFKVTLLGCSQAASTKHKFGVHVPIIRLEMYNVDY